MAGQGCLQEVRACNAARYMTGRRENKAAALALASGADLLRIALAPRQFAHERACRGLTAIPLRLVDAHRRLPHELERSAETLVDCRIAVTADTAVLRGQRDPVTVAGVLCTGRGAERHQGKHDDEAPHHALQTDREDCAWTAKGCRTDVAAGFAKKGMRTAKPRAG